MTRQLIFRRLMLLACMGVLIGLLEVSLVYAQTEKKPAETYIRVKSFGMGTTMYVTFFGMTELINKYSPWLRATIEESTGLVENIQSIQKYSRDMIVLGNPQINHPARMGLAPFNKPLPEAVIARAGFAGIAFPTLNPKIKTVADLKGKTIMLAEPRADYTPLVKTLLSFHGIDMNKEVRVVYGLWDKAKDGLLSGAVDVACVGLVAQTLKGMGIVPPAVEELMYTKTVYWMALDPEEVKRAAKMNNFPWEVRIIPKAANARFTSDVPLRASFNYWSCHPDMDDAIVTEFLRVLFDHYAELGKYHSANKDMSPEGFVDCGLPAKDYHRAAQEWYQQHNIKIVEP